MNRYINLIHDDYLKTRTVSEADKKTHDWYIYSVESKSKTTVEIGFQLKHGALYITEMKTIDE